MLTAAAALDAIEEGVLVHDAKHQIVYANRAASELLGVEPQALRGASTESPPWEAMDESGAPIGPDDCPVERALRTGMAQRPIVVGVRRRDGAVRWLRTSTRPFGPAVLTSLLDLGALRVAEPPRFERGRPSVLSPREREVLQLLAHGHTGEQAAARLGISPATVRVHIRNATGKLGASTRAQAVAIAVSRGEVPAP
jgi:PAS domain S-box-containing protein